VIVVMVGAAAVVGIAVIWYLLTRGPEATVPRSDFDREYDELVAKGEAVEGERDAAWRDFHGWQAEQERDRRAWEEPDE